MHFSMRSFEKEWQSRFERFARCHDLDHLISGWSESGLRYRLALVDELLRELKYSSPIRILDLGCGAGTYVRFLSSLGHRVVGLDYSIPSLHRALAADPKRVGHYTGGEVYNLPFCNECFDIVISIGVFQALERPEDALNEMARVLRPQGLLVVEFLNAFELVALIRSFYERLRSRLPRVRTYSPFQVRGWLLKCGLRPVRRYGVYLPPRRLPRLGEILNRKGILRLMEGTPGLPLLGAHAFLLVGRKKS